MEPQACGHCVEGMGMALCKPTGSPDVVGAKSFEALTDKTRELTPLSEARWHRSPFAGVLFAAQHHRDLDVVGCT